MLAPASVIKKTAKTAMSGKFLKCVIASAVPIFACLICLFISDLIGFATHNAVFISVFALLIFFLVIPLFLGTLRFFRRLLWNEDDAPLLVFHYLSSAELYKKALRFTFALGVRILGVGALLMLPAFIVELFTGTFLYDFLGIDMPTWISGLWIVSVFLGAAAQVMLFFGCLRWYLAPFLFVADEEMDVSEAIHMSTIISRGTALEFFLLLCSFALWILASVLMLPIVFTVPYFISAYIVHSRFAVAQYNRVCDEVNGSDVPSYAAQV